MNAESLLRRPHALGNDVILDEESVSVEPVRPVPGGGTGPEPAGRQRSPEGTFAAASFAPASFAPASFAQERFWLLQQLDPDGAGHTLRAALHLNVSIPKDSLERALREVISRHAVLRSRFCEIEGSIVQQPLSEWEATLDVRTADCTGLPRSAALAAVADSLAAAPFDLQRGALPRMARVRFPDGACSLVLVLHRIVGDESTLEIVLREVEAAARAGRLPEPPAQFAELAMRERERSAAGAFAPQLESRIAALRGAPAILELPVDRPRTAREGGQFAAAAGALHRFALCPSASAALRSMAERAAVPLAAAALAVFECLLARYTGQRDLLVGLRSRQHDRPAAIPGCLTNTLVARALLPPEATTDWLLARAANSLAEAERSAAVPFELLVQRLVTDHASGAPPLVQAGFCFEDASRTAGFEVLPGGLDLDLELCLRDRGTTIEATIAYNPGLFEPETLAAMASSFETLASGMAARPELPVEQLTAVAAEQEARWAGVHGPAAPIEPIRAEQWISRVAQASPESAAVVDGEGQLTYRELEEASNRLAHRLREMGVRGGGESLVAICMGRSAQTVIALLAVWKAGGAYLPLDSELPADRLAFMLEDSGAAVLVTEAALLPRLPERRPAVLCLDHDREWQSRDGSRPPALELPPGRPPQEETAYLIYTSGSTGRPKGVEIVHRALVNLLASMQREPGMRASDSILATTTFSFDMSGIELYLPLVSGARMVLAPRAASMDPEMLLGMVAEHGITVLEATPSTWRMLLESGWREGRGLKLFCGGEALTLELARRLLATGAELWNLYGPTETTIWSTLERVLPESTEISIGRPLANTEVHILDGWGHPAPRGVAGELWIGGAGLARGYRNRPELTAERFVESELYAARLYRTGDLARWLPGGRLEYKGRMDHQVKVRGYRIELGEIEATLEQAAGVEEAVVVVRRDVADEPRLTAYIRRSGGAAVSEPTLRAALLDCLPGYMVPEAFVFLEAFPLSASLKVDRGALEGPQFRPAGRGGGERAGDGQRHPDAPADGRPDPPDEAVPATEIQRTMAALWCEVLGLDRIGLRDNFFELGGHSLAAVRLISRLRSAFGMELPLKFLFLYPTVGELSAHISYDPATRRYGITSELPKWSCLVPVQPRGTERPLFFVAGYENPEDTLLSLSQLAPHLGLDQPLFGLRPRWVEGSEGYDTVQDMAREFVAEIRRVQPRGPYRLGGHCVGGIAALEIARALQAEGDSVSLMIFLDTERPSRLRTLQLDLYYMRMRLRHMLEVAAEIVRSGRDFLPRVRGLVRRKLHEPNTFYKAKVSYRRQLYTHIPRRYQGRITLIVNRTEAAERGADMGWRQVAENGVDSHVVDGNHDTVLVNHADQVGRAMLAARDRDDPRLVNP